MQEISIRTMTPEDLQAAMALKDAEGWNQTLEDWQLFLRNGPEFCLVATHDGVVVGTVTGISYENRVAWIGMMLVNKSHRGLGISKHLMKAVIERLDVASSIKLDATPAGYPVYEKLGFNEEFALIRMTATDPFIASGQSNLINPHIVPLDQEGLHDLKKMDREAFGADRLQVLAHALRQQPTLAFMYQDDAGVKGYIMSRTGTRYTHLGPLVAMDEHIAKTLLEFAVKGVKGLPLVIDVPILHPSWATWLESCGFQKQRDLYRMYLKGNPFPGKPMSCFLVAGPELG